MKLRLNITDGLLFLIVASFPIQEDVPPVFGASISFILVSLLGITCVLNGFEYLKMAMQEPLFKAILAYILVVLIIETLHPLSSYNGILRIVFNSAAALLIAAAIRTRSSVKAIVSGYIFSGLYLSILLFIYGWGSLTESSGNFYESEVIRTEVLTEMPITQNANTMAYTIAVSLLLLTIVFFSNDELYNKKQKGVFIVFSAMLTAGLLTALSRSAIVVLISTSLALIFYFRKTTFKIVVTGFVVAIAIYLIAPNSFINRMKINTSIDKSDVSNYDARTWVFYKSIEEIKKNFYWGVGEGNLQKGEYRKSSALRRTEVETDNRIKIVGSHNLIFENIILWGVFAEIAHLIVIVIVLRGLPPRKFSSFYAVVFVTNVASIILMFFMHNFSNKEFAVAYGLFLAYQLNERKKKAQALKQLA